MRAGALTFAFDNIPSSPAPRSGLQRRGRGTTPPSHPPPARPSPSTSPLLHHDPSPPTVPATPSMTYSKRLLLNAEGRFDQDAAAAAAAAAMDPTGTVRPPSLPVSYPPSSSLPLPVDPLPLSSCPPPRHSRDSPPRPTITPHPPSHPLITHPSNPPPPHSPPSLSLSVAVAGGV